MSICVDCGEPAAGTRCPDCRTLSARAREARRGTREQRGYGWDWRRIAAATIAEQPWCSQCGTTADLTVDHILPKVRGGTDEPHNLRVLCRTHNSAKGAS